MSQATVARLFGVMLIAAVFGLAFGCAAKADKLTEQNMTQKDYNEITQTESSEAGAKPVPVEPVHDLTDGGAAAAKSEGAVKVAKGKDWKKMSPKERDRLLRDLKQRMKVGTGFIVEVPSGNVWALDGVAYDDLYEDMWIEPWSKEEFEKLPKAVKRDPLNPQQDRRADRPKLELDTHLKF